MSIYERVDEYVELFLSQGYDIYTSWEMAYNKCEEVLK